MSLRPLQPSAAAATVVAALMLLLCSKPTPVVGAIFKSRDRNAFHGGRGEAPANGGAGAIPPRVLRRVHPALDDAESQLLKQMEERTRFSSCWREAVAALQAACDDALATDEDRSRLALRFTACQLQMDGKGGVDVDCPASHDTRVCVGALGSEFYPVYVQFRIHANALCFHIEADNFQLRTARAVDSLSSASQMASGKLQDLAQRSARIGASLDELRAHHAGATEAAAALHALLTEHASEHGDALSALGTAAEQIVSGIAALRGEAQAAQEQHAASVRGLREGVAALTNEHAAASEGAAELTAAVRQLVGFASESLERHHEHVVALSASAEAIASHAHEQRHRLEASNLVVLEALDRVHGSFASFEALLFYGTFAFAAFFSTASRRTEAARFPALVGVVAALLCENWLCRTHRAATEAALTWAGDCALRYAILWAARDVVDGSSALTVERHGVWCVRNAWIVLVLVALLVALSRYEAPEEQQRRVVREELRRHLGAWLAREVPGTLGVNAVSPPPPSASPSGSGGGAGKRRRMAASRRTDTATDTEA